jgi:tetratricopeptide (TPR) repeat protein
MIVRDEERFLEGCLHSLIGCVDDLVVVDTGSVDRSREIAQDAGARVLDYPWSDDFAAARNAALDAVRGDWILYIDADERVVSFDRAQLDPLLADSRHAALTVLFRPLSGHTRYREHRLFRNCPELRFRGVIHESVVPALNELCAREKMLIGHSAVRLDHYGYDGDLRRKHERNLPLLRARLAREPEHVYSWAHLGETLLALGDEAQAEQAWRRGVGIVRRRRRKLPEDSLPHLHLATFLLDRERDADALLSEGCRWYPDNHALAWLRARRLVDTGLYAEAMPLFTRLAAIDPDRLVEGSMAFDVTIFGANAYAALALCAFRLGRLDESAAYYKEAEALAPDNLEFRTKRALASAKAGR